MWRRPSRPSPQTPRSSPRQSRLVTQQGSGRPHTRTCPLCLAPTLGLQAHPCTAARSHPQAPPPRSACGRAPCLVTGALSPARLGPATAPQGVRPSSICSGDSRMCADGCACCWHLTRGQRSPDCGVTPVRNGSAARLHDVASRNPLELITPSRAGSLSSRLGPVRLLRALLGTGRCFPIISAERAPPDLRRLAFQGSF